MNQKVKTSPFPLITIFLRYARVRIIFYLIWNIIMFALFSVVIVSALSNDISSTSRTNLCFQGFFQLLVTGGTYCTFFMVGRVILDWKYSVMLKRVGLSKITSLKFWLFILLWIFIIIIALIAIDFIGILVISAWNKNVNIMNVFNSGTLLAIIFVIIILFFLSVLMMFTINFAPQNIANVFILGIPVIIIVFFMTIFSFLIASATLWKGNNIVNAILSTWWIYLVFGAMIAVSCVLLPITIKKFTWSV